MWNILKQEISFLSEKMGIMTESNPTVINKRNRWNSFCELDQSMHRQMELPNLGHTEINVIKGDFESLAENVKEYIAEHVSGQAYHVK